MNQQENYISEEVLEAIQARTRQTPLLNCYDPHDHWEMQKELPYGPIPTEEKLRKYYKVNTNNVSWWMWNSVYEMFQKISCFSENKKELEWKQLITDINDGRFTSANHDKIYRYRKELTEKYNVSKEALNKIAWYNLEKILVMFSRSKSDYNILLKDIEREKYAEIYSVLPQPIKRSDIEHY